MEFAKISEQYEKTNTLTYGSEVRYRNKANVEQITKALPEDAEYDVISRDGKKIYDAKTFLSTILTSYPEKGGTVEYLGEIWDVDNWKNSGTGELFDLYCIRNDRATNRRTSRER
jgi:hypothetical protein